MVLNFKYGIQDNQEDEMARQAREMEERMKNGGGGLKKKGPLVKKEQPKTMFDSADFQMKQQQAQQQPK